MASTTTTTVLLLFTVILFISTITVTSRPCKTIFFITTSTTTTTTTTLQNPNPNPTRLTFFITEIHNFHRTTSFHPNHYHDVVSSKPYFPSPSSSSIRDRTMDIISIVGALLFGIGCGAITAGTIYLIWFLFSNQQLDFDSDDSEDEFDYGDDDVSPRNKNKDGYVAVGNKEVPPSADEVDAMKS